MRRLSHWGEAVWPQMLINLSKRAGWKAWISPFKNASGHSWLIKNTVHSAGLVSYGRTQTVVTPWISVPSWCSPTSPAGNEYNEVQLNIRHELNASLHKDLNIWWPHFALEMEHSAAVGLPESCFTTSDHRWECKECE